MASTQQIPLNQTQRRPYTYIQRRRIVKSASVLDHSISHIRSIQCSAHCLNPISSSSISSLRSQYQSKTQLQRNAWLQQWLENNKINIGTNKYMYRWHIDGIEVCLHCWLSVTGATKYKIAHCTRYIHGNTGIAHLSDHLETALAWLETYLYSVCDHMSTKNQYHLPCFLQWKDVLTDLNSHLDSKKLKRYSQPQFAHLIKKNFSNVKLPKYTKLGKCDVCLDLKEKRLKAKTEDEKLNLQRQIIDHNTNQMKERIEYKKRCLRAGIIFLFLWGKWPRLPS